MKFSGLTYAPKLQTLKTHFDITVKQKCQKKTQISIKKLRKTSQQQQILCTGCGEITISKRRVLISLTTTVCHFPPLLHVGDWAEWAILLRYCDTAYLHIYIKIFTTYGTNTY